MATDLSMSAYSVAVDGADLEPDWHSKVVSIRVEESVQLPDLFVIRFADPDFELFDSGEIQIGSKIEVALQGAGELTVVTVGEVTSIAVEPNAANIHELVIEGFDPTHRLHRGPKTRVFVQVTDSDIAETLAREYSLTADVDATSEVHEHLVQHNMSDLSFLRQRADRIGFDVWVTEETLFFKHRPEARTTPPQLTWRDNLLRFRARFSSAEHCEKVLVQGWDPINKEAIEGHSDAHEAGSDASAVDESMSQSRQAFGSLTRTMTTQPVSNQSEAEAFAESLALLASGSEAVARGVCNGDPQIAAGSSVRVANVGSRLSGEYRVTEVVHTIETDKPYLTKFVAGPRDSSSIPDLLGSARNGAGLGATFARVVDVVDPQRVGRAKVEFGHLTGTESSWAPVVSPGAGDARGVQFLPEVGDQVLLVFEMGDPDRPIILGGVWSKADELADPDAVASGSVDRRVLKSREGHQLLLDDSGAGVIELSLSDESCAVHLEGAGSSLIGDQTLKLEATEIRLSAQTKLVLEAAQIEISGDSEVKISGAIINLN